MPGSPHYTPELQGLPPISFDGTNKISDHRVWLARQLLDSKLDDGEAYSIVFYSPAMDAHRKATTK